MKPDVVRGGRTVVLARHAVLGLVVLTMFAACGRGSADSRAPESQARPAAAAAIEAALAAPRSEEDRARDALRHPRELLAFAGVAPGMTVADLGAGPGYTASLVAAVVGEDGRVYAHNPAEFREWAEPGWAARKAGGALPQVELVTAPFDAPLGEHAAALAGRLDLVLSVLVYHDTVGMKVDRSAMNRAVFAALKPGGVYVVLDHHAASGVGTSRAGDLHRIEATTVRAEVEAAGFVFDGASEAWATPGDTRDFVAWGEPQPVTDRFAFRFVKPR